MGKNEVLIHDEHRCRGTAMTPQEILNHLKDEGNSTNKAYFIHLKKLNTFSQGHTRQNPFVN